MTEREKIRAKSLQSIMIGIVAGNIGFANISKNA